MNDQLLTLGISPPLAISILRLSGCSPLSVVSLALSLRPQKCDCLLSLEAYSSEQKRRVCQCLKDNIDKQLQLQRREPAVQHFDQVGSLLDTPGQVRCVLSPLVSGPDRIRPKT